MTVVIGLSTGLLIGLVLGLTGAGGSIFAVPLLVILLDLAPQNAMGIALGAVSCSAALGAITHYRNVLWIPAGLLAGTGAIAAPIGRWLAGFFNDATLIVGFSLLTGWIAHRMFTQARRQPESTKQVRASHFDDPSQDTSLACRMSPTGQFEMAPRCLFGISVGGLMVGVVSGLFGVGGGFLIIPLLMYLSNLTMPRAIATSLVVIACVSASGFFSHFWIHDVHHPLLFLVVVIASMVGMMTSRRISHYCSGPHLQILFSGLLILSALALLVKVLLLSPPS